MKKILIDCKKDSAIRIAVTENGELSEMLAERKNSSSLVGNIYAGVVKNISPSQFMFIDIGKSKNVFIHLNDNKESGLRNENGRLSVKIGDSVLLQIVKDAHGDKGASATTKISFTGMFMVVSKIGNGAEIGISKKIDGKEERERLKKIMRNITPAGYDIIIRTRSEGRDEEELRKELDELVTLCEKAENEWCFVKAPALVYDDGRLLEKAFRELYSEDVDEIAVNEWEQYSLIKMTVENASAFEGVLEKLNFYNEDELSIPIFEKYGIENKTQKALQKKVWLKSGGFLIIEKTEACYVIDVNTGKYTNGKGHEQSVFKVNEEAAAEIALQIRIRNMSGIIIVDFIDMKSEAHKESLMRVLQAELKKDRISNNLCGMTELGLVLITRKKIRESITDIMTAECGECCGTGRVMLR